MGDPKKLRKKYRTPSHPWQKERIDEEKVIMRQYGLKNKKELWKQSSSLRKFKRQVKQIVPRRDAQAEKEKQLLVKKCMSLKLIKRDAKIEDILGLELEDICKRRLQSLVYTKGISSTMRQARQYVTHGHIVIGDKKITSPSFLVTESMESMIGIAPNSSVQMAPSEPEPKKPVAKPEVKNEK